ncbi:hypothetical protein DFH09DRAFT_300810 [Mycena vulgaris]|nr:hypothetical protein DFH09DRAFT_300810 [Mycena vulgaris]
MFPLVRKIPDVHRWISKVTSICTHFRCVANVTRSQTHRNLLDMRVIGVNNSGTQSIPVSIDFQGIRDVLRDALESSKSEEKVNGATYEKRIIDFLQDLALIHRTKLQDDGKLTVSPVSSVHCECVILGAIHNSQAIPYVGVSKLSCSLCQLYFAIYRGEVTGTNIYTRGTHSGTVAWRFPHHNKDLGADADQIELRFRSSLLDSVATGWKNYIGRPNSSSSQSTNRSGDEDVIPGMCLIHPMFEEYH